MKIWLLSTLIILSNLAIGGGGSSGGGFVSSYGSGDLLKASIEDTLYRLSSLKEKCVNQFLGKRGLHPVRFSEMRDIIQKTRKSYLKEQVRQNPEGESEPLFFNYGTDEKGPYIEALKPYFTTFVGYERYHPMPEQVRVVDRMLVHEASHHFGYSEKEADKFTQILWEITVLWNEGCDTSREHD